MSKQITILSFLISYFLFFFSEVFAQQPVLRHYTVEDGLPSSLIYQAIEDKEGYMWFATDRGISRFDGYGFENFSVQDGLPSNDVWGLEVDLDGKIWLASFNEVVYYDDGQFHTVANNDIEKAEISKIEAYQIDEKGNRYLTTGKKNVFYLTEKDSLRFFEARYKEENFKEIVLSFLCVDKKGNNLYFAKAITHEKVRKLLLYRQNEDGDLELVVDVIVDDIRGYFDFAMEREKDVVFFYSRGFSIFDFNSLHSYSLDSLFDESIELSSVLPIGGDKFLFSTSQGYYVLDKDLKILPGFEFLNNYDLNRIFEDRNGNLWLCTINDGLYFLSVNAGQSSSYSPAQSLSGNEILSLAIDRKGQVWAGTSTGQLFAFQNGQFKEFVIQGLLRKGVRMRKLVFSQKEGTLYVASDLGLFVFTEKELEKKSIKLNSYKYRKKDTGQIPIGYNLYYGNMKTVSLEAGGEIWSGKNVGAYKLIPQQEHYDFVRYYQGVPVFAIASNGLDSTWLGQKDGISLVEGDSIKKIKGEEVLFQRPINDLKFDKKGRLWVATDGYGLFAYRNGQVDTIRELERVIVESISVDDENRIWVATNQGVRKITIKKDKPFQYDFTLLTTAHGLASSEVNEVLVVGEDIYIGSKKGLTVLQDKPIYEVKELPPLRFTGIKINGEEFSKQDSFTLEYNQNNIAIHYVCFSYKSAGQIRYKYKMNGIDPAWQKTDDLKKEYPVLPPGEYTFRLKAIDIDGVEVEEKTIYFHVLYPWWKRWWALLGFTTLSALSLFWVVRRELRKAKEKAEAQTKVDKKIAHLELEALQAQMNPHFVFNAMQSIQNFIFRKEERTANRYMVKFSRLMRLFLESSRNRYIPLEDEIKMLTFYVELEKMRFPDRFDYLFDLEESLGNQQIMVPSMLIQPFVENAINHGLIQSEKEGGKLTVTMMSTEEYFTCIVDDNGIGRKKAQELRQQSFKHHKSRGMQIIDERLRVMNLISDQKVSIDVIDKEDDQGNPQGTKVKIQFPLKN